MARRAIVYTRFSPRPGAEGCTSCEAQERCCRDFAAARGWEVAAVYSDRATSGTVEASDRALGEAVAALRRGWALVVYRRDRLARDLAVSLGVESAVRRAGAEIVAVDGDVSGGDASAVFARQIMAAAAQYERAAISARVSAAMRAYQREGRRMGAHCPFGWRPDPSDARRMVPDEAARRVADEILRMRAEGLGYQRIARRLNDSGARAAGGGAWSAAQVLRVVRRAARTA